ncbi:glycosyltransferase family 4 protein [Bacteroides pyogenes]|uniref:glycosyltransferase family 4 protein n=1 Tax=Bacteroides pyogenes TaxID=310300 RepID=UPI0011E43FB8|nr:glycosyltransferase family 4 protein [Bacteroides pyogenes]TYK37821.1 glycosyltransferase family 4 protein [Bacteroides pyogenes]
MKICIISSNYPSEGLPLNVFVEQLVNELMLQSIDIEVIAPQSVTRALFRHGALLPYLDYRIIGGRQYKVWRPYYVSLGNCSGWLHRILEKIRFRGIKKIIDSMRVKPDVLYGHFWQSAYVVKNYALKHRLPLFVACGEGDNALENLVSFISTTEKRELVSAVTGVISVSTENKRKCVEYGLAKSENIIVLPNSVDISLFDSSKGVNKRNEINVKDNDFLIAFIGSFIHRKGSARLAAAIDMLDDPQIKVMYIGKEQPGDDATPHCKGIVFKGCLNHQLIPDYLKSADIFCLPTLNEGCSNAIVEALSCGLPVISSNKPFNYDVLDESNSLLIEPMNVEEIAQAIKKLKEDVILRKKLSEGAMKKANLLRLDVRVAKIINFIKSYTISE